jgi:allantoinase
MTDPSSNGQKAPPFAVWVIPNIEFFPLTRGIASHPGAPVGNPHSVRAWAWPDYGNRVCIWRLMDVLSKHGIRASPTLNSDIRDDHPQIVRAAVDLGWEILGHNQTNSGWLDQLALTKNGRPSPAHCQASPK